MQSREVVAALAAYDAERRPAIEAVVLTNRGGGPERVIDVVEERAPNGFEDVEAVASYAEREAIVRGYAATAGSRKPDERKDRSFRSRPALDIRGVRCKVRSAVALLLLGLVLPVTVTADELRLLSTQTAVRTGKERLGDKADDEQRVDDCKVPQARRTRIRPTACPWDKPN